MTRATNRIIKSLAPALVMATLGAGGGHELRSPDELDAARSLPPHQLAAVAEGMSPRSWDCTPKRRSDSVP